jgi:hypothetical protein
VVLLYDLVFWASSYRPSEWMGHCE